MILHNNPYVKDAEAAGKYAAEWIHPTKKHTNRNVSPDVIYRMAVWTGHWAGIAINNKTQKWLRESETR